MLSKNTSDDKIYLRALTRQDAQITWRWRNDPEIRLYYSGHPFFVNLEKEESWYEKIITTDLPLCAFGIVNKVNNELVGLTFLNNINLINRAAEFSILIGNPEARGKGFAKIATLKTIKFGFFELNLNRISLKVHENNFKAINLYEKCGFKKEGLLRESAYKSGLYINEFVMSILRNEFIDP